MESDLYGDEMSSVREGGDERNSRGKRQKQTKACTQIHSCRKWKERIRSTPSLYAPLERSPLLTVTRGKWSDAH